MFQMTKNWAIALLMIGLAVPYSYAEEMHMHHHQTDSHSPVKRSFVDVNLDATPLNRQDGKAVTLNGELADKKPVVLAFIYTSCTTVCPVTSQVLSKTQTLLGKDIEGVHIVSVSIDPEFDTPAKLREYSKKFDAKPQWQHYTGTLANSIAVQKAFKAFRGDKMNHDAVMFVNGGGKKTWLRLDGFPSAEELVKELREQIKG